MIKLQRTNSGNHDFISLVELLDADLAVRDGEEHAFYAGFNKIHSNKFVIVAYENQKAIACGALKEFDAGIFEIKRMYVLPGSRKRGIASMVLKELECWARELSYSKVILETGKMQPEAIALYLKNGYKPIVNYGQYAGVSNSVCFEKVIA